MAAQLSPSDIFLKLPEHKQKILAFQVMTGLSNTDDLLLTTLNKNAYVGKESVTYYSLSSLYYATLANKGICMPHDSKLTPEASYQIAQTVATPRYPYHQVVMDHVQRMFPFKKIDYKNQPMVTNHVCMRQAIFLNRSGFVEYDHQRSPADYTQDIKLVQTILYDSALDMDWLESRALVIRALICCAQLLFVFVDHSKRAVDFQKIRKVYQTLPLDQLHHDYLYYLMIQIDIALGDVQAAHEKLHRIADKNSIYFTLSQSLLLFFEQEYTQFRERMQAALPMLKKAYKKRSFCFNDLVGLCYFFQKIHVEEVPKIAMAEMDAYEKHGLPVGFDLQDKFFMLRQFALLKQGHKDKVEQTIKQRFGSKPMNPLHRGFYELIRYTLNTRLTPARLAELNKLLSNYKTYRFFLVAHIFAEIIVSNKRKDPVATQVLTNSAIKLRFLDLVQAKAPWEYNMIKLESMLLDQPTEPKKPVVVTNKRLIWLLDPDTLAITIMEQSIKKDGHWSKGRPVALQPLYESPSQYPYLTELDEKALQGLRKKQERYWYHPKESYEFDKDTTLLNLVGHPHIYHVYHRDMRIELEYAEPYVYIHQNKSMYEIKLSHHLDDAGVILEAIAINKYRVIDFSYNYVAIQQVLSEKGMKFPKAAKQHVLNLIQHAKRDIKIQAEMSDMNLPEIKASTIPCLQIFPRGEAINIKIWVRPFTDQGPYCRPGIGNPSVIAAVTEGDAHSRKKATRDFDLETQANQDLLSACPTLANYEEGDYNVQIEDKEDILELLTELSAYKKHHAVTIEWPQGETYKIKQELSADNLSLTITSGQSWFEYDGEIALNDDQVLEMQLVLEGLSKTPSRFIQLDDGSFLALNQHLKKQLQVLYTLSEDGRIAPLGANVLDELAQEAAQVKVDKKWKAHLAKVDKMRQYTPSLPNTLQAQLRDYQEDGFRYLSRLINWGIGACLADDMGLGKTIQAIALMLTQSTYGPTLVIAPKSVCFNWESEIRKFGPTLNTYLMHAIDKEKLLNRLTKLDVLICSYGLLHHNSDLLADKTWQTIILDEAQAIKNPATKRWKAAMKLQGKNRIALTGTPIENHLGELWSIFNFLNPGLLGSYKAFQHKFATPIEVYRDQSVKYALKKLITPFILRRTKSAVLDELPPKMEQTIYIEPNEDEIAFYEALRVRALKNIKAQKGKNKRFKILAEINRLRQACCHPRLVEQDLDIDCSKLDYLKELLQSLKENNHKVLVFSQYVRYLELVKPMIESLKLKYHYLDGSTSSAHRQAAVEGFQSGDSDVFLLTLKAGGSGLNLTAADYVIHLDPWWNPAVEDQASDRAHRIGQQRPVTIYRLIIQNTIEEKIINMHKDKRDLASELLAGQNVTGKLSESDLVNLITG